jgi:cation diffusion facilitator family transporter
MEQQTKIDEKKQVALVSVIAAIFITAMKLVVGIQTNSLGILSEAAHSGLDLVAALITYFAVRVSDRPPDEEHHYGHGKVENVSAFMETLLLFVTCAWIVWEAINRLAFRTPHVEMNIWGYIVITVAIVVDISRSRVLSKVAKKYHSQALEADALHFSSDIWSSLVVLAGLMFISIGYAWVDAVAAIAVAILVLFVSYRLGRRTIDALMDRVPSGISEDVQKILQRVDGVEKIQHVRLRTSGGKLFIDATVSVRRTLLFHQVHHIMDVIEKSIQDSYPNADVIVHAEPVESVNETIADKVRMIVVGKGLRVPHNLEVRHSHGTYQIDFDVEYQKGKTFVEAHDLTSEIERDIIEKIPEVEHVTIHMEESEPDHIEIGGEEVTALENEVQAFISQDGRVMRCPVIKIIRVGNKYNLSLACQFEKTKTLEDVHQIVCELETRLYDRFKEFRRITVHAEPA